LTDTLVKDALPVVRYVEVLAPYVFDLCYDFLANKLLGNMVTSNAENEMGAVFRDFFFGDSVDGWFLEEVGLNLGFII